MKRSVLVTTTAIYVLAIFIFMGSCTEKDEQAILDINNGSKMFWTDKAMLSGSIKVYISFNITSMTPDVQGYVTIPYPSNTLDNPPPCDAVGCFRQKFKGLEDFHTYYWKAIDSLSPSQVHKWEGNFIIFDDNREHCNSVRLSY